MGKLESMGDCLEKTPHTFTNQTGGCGKGRLVAKSLEWIPCGEFLNMAEFNIEKGPTGLKDKTLIIDKVGSLNTANEYEQIPPTRTRKSWGIFHIS